jgi:hypothetical protein
VGSVDWVTERDPPDPCLEPFQVWFQSNATERGLSGGVVASVGNQGDWMSPAGSLDLALELGGAVVDEYKISSMGCCYFRRRRWIGRAGMDWSLGMAAGRS